MTARTRRAPTPPAPRESRSGGKTRARQARRYTPELRARAVELYGSVGLAEAARVTGAAKPTIVRWARVAGVDSAQVAAAAQARTAEATRRSQAELARRMAEGRAQLAPKLVLQANGALDATLAITDALRAVQRAAVEHAGVVDSQLTGRLAGVMLGPTVHELVGLTTRAIHDLQLLTGEDTERGAGQVSVTFVVAPAPSDRPAPVVIDLPPATAGLDRRT